MSVVSPESRYRSALASCCGGNILKIDLLKHIDAIFAPALLRLLPRAKGKNRAFRPSRSALLIRPGGIGDAILLIPAIQWLKSSYPELRIDVLAETRNAAAFKLTPDVYRVFLYDRPAQLVQVMSRTYDVVIDTEQWYRLSAVVARLFRSRLRIGFATNERKKLFHVQIPYEHGRFEAESFLDLVTSLVDGERPGLSRPYLRVPAAVGEIVKDKYPSLACSVVIFPGASIPERRWGSENFQALCRRLRQDGVPVVVVGGAGDRASAERIAAGTEVLNLAGQTSLVETSALIAASRCLVTGDSGLMHIAAGLGVPTVSLFGPGIEEKWAPKGKRHVVLNARLSCSPCTKFGVTPDCSRGAACLSAITVDEVFGAVMMQLENWSH